MKKKRKQVNKSKKYNECVSLKLDGVIKTSKKNCVKLN